MIFQQDNKPIYATSLEFLQTIMIQIITGFLQLYG